MLKKTLSILILSGIYIGLQASSFDDSQICKAGIATLMGRSPKIMTSKHKEESNKPLYIIKYNRQDGTNWSFKCNIDGSRINWGSESGRWRNDPLDEKLTFSISKDNKNLLVWQMQGVEIVAKKTFTQKDLQ